MEAFWNPELQFVLRGQLSTYPVAESRRTLAYVLQYQKCFRDLRGPTLLVVLVPADNGVRVIHRYWNGVVVLREDHWGFLRLRRSDVGSSFRKTSRDDH